jgi:hypothetical protein
MPRISYINDGGALSYIWELEEDLCYSWLEDGQWKTEVGSVWAIIPDGEVNANDMSTGLQGEIDRVTENRRRDDA